MTTSIKDLATEVTTPLDGDYLVMDHDPTGTPETVKVTKANLMANAGAVTATSVTAADVYGSTASGGALTLHSTSHATKGKINFGTSGYYDESTGQLVVNGSSESGQLTVNSKDVSTVGLVVSNYASATANIAEFQVDGTAKLTVGPSGELGAVILDRIEATISSGTASVSSSYGIIDTEGSAATDDLDTISPWSDGKIIVLKAKDNARTVVVKNGTGNIRLAGAADFSLDHTRDTIMLMFTSSLGAWLEISRSNNA